MQKVVQYKDNWRVGAKISHDNVKVLKPVAHHNSIESRGSCLHTGGIPTWTFHLEHFNWSADPVWKIHGLHSALYLRSKRCAWAHWLTRVEKGCALSLSCSVKQPWHGTLSNVFFLEIGEKWPTQMRAIKVTKGGVCLSGALWCFTSPELCPGGSWWHPESLR